MRYLGGTSMRLEGEDPTLLRQLHAALSIAKTPISDHPLVGHPDPLHTPNRLVHGTFDQSQITCQGPDTHMLPTQAG
ncbi:hypothetical protein [Rhodococcus qingshengii]|uniref:hypothetical protein n=1 Tax=Rhodococcus qingshengii TaxID=334542 RepID=UPI001F138A48|nr:hypothetical protein [Rhodococcus qingshengii]